MKILDAKGGEIAEPRPKLGVSPKGCAEQLRREIKDESGELLASINDAIQGLEKSLKMTWEEVKELQEKARAAVRHPSTPSRDRRLVVR